MPAGAQSLLRLNGKIKGKKKQSLNVWKQTQQRLKRMSEVKAVSFLRQEQRTSKGKEFDFLFPHLDTRPLLHRGWLWGKRLGAMHEKGCQCTATGRTSTPLAICRDSVEINFASWVAGQLSKVWDCIPKAWASLNYGFYSRMFAAPADARPCHSL
ncbi:hypothetical protein VTI74DRAFT_763 [Chaetomium olivicolor]